MSKFAQNPGGYPTRGEHIQRNQVVSAGLLAADAERVVTTATAGMNASQFHGEEGNLKIEIEH
jgi:hypothetical protein